MRNYLLLMMGGKGTRFGADIPKQYISVENVPVFAYILKKYCEVDAIDEIVVVSHKDWIDFVQDWIKKIGIEAKKKISVVEGGATRSESVLNGLKKANETACYSDVVMMHDATHPYVDEKGTLEVIEAVKTVGGATLAQFQYDTVYRKNDDDMLEEVIDRKAVVSGASPEAFRFGDIFKIYTETPEEDFERMTSAGAIALANNIPMRVVKANVINLKITYKEDMEIFKQLATSYFFGEKEED